MPAERQVVDPALGRGLERQAAAILARLPASGDVRDEVRSVLSTQLTVGDMRIGAVARRLTTTPRTLPRRLARAGTSFDALCDDARKHAAAVSRRCDAEDRGDHVRARVLRTDRVSSGVPAMARHNATRFRARRV
jgi:hypothetical protein